MVGATGTVGSGVLRQLVAGDERARALVRDREKAGERLGEQIELVVGDLDRPETLRDALAGVDRVFLLTRQTTRQLEQERAMVQAAVRAGVRQVAKLHTMLATGYEDVVTDDVRTVTGHLPRTVAQFAADFAPRLAGRRQQP